MSAALPSELTIYSVGELRPLWLDELGMPVDDEVFELAAAAVDQVDAAGLQLLLSLSHALVQRGRRLRLADASRPLREACLALGLGRLLEAEALA